jgi:hypothetical protein
MRSRSFFVLVSILAFAGIGAAQRQVTNADLETYRDQRVRAQAELRQDYARLGFPSPAELERREKERNRHIDQLASTLRQQSLDENKSYREYESAFASRPQQVIVEQPEQDPFHAGDPVYPTYGYPSYGYPGYGYPGTYGYPGYGTPGDRSYDIFGFPRYGRRNRGWGF